MNNIKVYIIDDEFIVREGLRTYVPWLDYGMEVVGVAENGQEAYEYLSGNEVDLVISDIYMPYVDGLELIEKLKSINKNPVVILISGHSDFNYAKRAIKTNMVFEYILKPVNFEELDKVLAGAREKILSQGENNDFPLLTEEEWKIIISDEKNNRVIKQSQIIDEIKSRNKSKSKELFVKSWVHMIENNYSNQMFKRYSVELIVGMMELVLEQRNTKAVFKEDPIHFIRTRNEINEIRVYVEKMINTTFSSFSEKHSKALSPVINAALDYINENYHSHDQSLNSLAEKLNVSPNYLCLKFKEETGINYTRYLNGLRVKQAKELLKDARLKVYTISDIVGFEDTRYFSRIFRAYTGYTPTEYQKRETTRKDT